MIWREGKTRDGLGGASVRAARQRGRREAMHATLLGALSAPLSAPRSALAADGVNNAAVRALAARSGVPAGHPCRPQNVKRRPKAPHGAFRPAICRLDLAIVDLKQRRRCCERPLYATAIQAFAIRRIVVSAADRRPTGGEARGPEACPCADRVSGRIRPSHARTFGGSACWAHHIVLTYVRPAAGRAADDRGSPRSATSPTSPFES
jgi:hypothetical protein